MAINKRFAHLNHSGSNHSILDAESAYITGTLQVGPAIPALGSDVNFFVSGNIGGEQGATPGVGVFGGDLVVSGNLHFLGGITGSIPEAYWSSPSLGVIKAETSSSLVEVPFLSASNGAEITGSATFNVEAPGQSVIISGSGNNLTPAFDVVNTAFGPGNEYSIFQVDPAIFSVKAITVDPNNYVEMDLNSPSLDVVSGSDHQITLNASVDAIGITVSGSAAAISVYDVSSSTSGALDLQIIELRINGDAGTAGYVLTSSGAGVAPGWAPVATPSIASEYWFSSGSGAIATTGSVALVGGDYPTNDKASDYGTDIFLYVSGDIYGRTNSLQNVAVFGGDTVVSGTLFADNKLKVYDGPGGPILELDNGTGQASFYVSITGSSGMLLTGSAVFAGAGGISVGSDTEFFVSGNNGGVVAGNGVAVFGGDVLVSGALYAKDDVDVVGKLVVSGNAVFAQGMTGSIPWVDEAGTLPFLVAGPNTTVNFLPTGQWAITGSDETQPELYYVAGTDPNGTAATSGSLVVSGALVVTGAAYFSPAGTGRGLLNFGGLDIGPITGSLTLTGSTQIGYALGDVLSASNGAGPNAVVEHEMHVLAVGALTNSSGIVEHFFSATYLVTSKIDNAGVQSLIGSVELTREASGSFVNQWDVNVESDMKVALTGTMNNGGSNEVRWFVERTRERSMKW